MVKNQSGIAQGFYHNSASVEIPPRFVFDPLWVVPKNKDFAEVKNVQDEIEKSETIMVLRTFGLGDVLMLIPVIQELRANMKRHRDIVLATSALEFRAELVEILGGDAFDRYVEAGRIGNHYDVGFFLDWYVERDHATEGFLDTHRVDLYRRFFGLPQGIRPVWSDETEKGTGEYVVLHEGGNRDVKALPPATFEHLRQRLAEKYEVRTLKREERLSAPKLVELIMEASCLVTMDSSPLWIAHFTRTPVVAILGPTREQDRLSYHPLYPDGTRAIALNEWVKCQPCRESMSACQGKRTCLNVDKEQLAESVLKSVEEVRWTS